MVRRESAGNTPATLSTGGRAKTKFLSAKVKSCCSEGESPSGLAESRRKHYTFCFVMACVECLSVPFGTVLGVFTILVLNRASVKELFNPKPAA